MGSWVKPKSTQIRPWPTPNMNNLLFKLDFPLPALAPLAKSHGQQYTSPKKTQTSGATCRHLAIIPPDVCPAKRRISNFPYVTSRQHWASNTGPSLPHMFPNLSHRFCSRAVGPNGVARKIILLPIVFSL